MLYNIKRTLMIKSAHDSSLRDKRSRSLFFILMIFMIVAIVAISVPQSTVSSIILSAFLLFDPSFIELSMDPSATYEEIAEATLTAAENIPSWAYAPVIAATGFAILFSILYCKIFEKRKPFSMGFNKREMLSEYFIGLFIGAIMILLPALACHISGSIVFTPAKDTLIPAVIAFFIAFVLQGLGEEALFRGYLITSIARKHNIWFAIIVSSVIFSIFHMPNDSFSLIAFINIFLFGVFASVVMLKRGSIWMSAAIHTAWNFIQGNVLGINVSGNPKFDTVIDSKLGKFGAILSGGEFGLEGGLGVTTVLLIAILLALLSRTKECEIAPAEEEKAEETIAQ